MGECFLRIGIKKSCLIQELLTSPNYQLEQTLIQRKLCWSDQVARLLAMTKTMEEEEASLSEHRGIAIVLSFIPSHQNIIPSNHRAVIKRRHRFLQMYVLISRNLEFTKTR